MKPKKESGAVQVSVVHWVRSLPYPQSASISSNIANTQDFDSLESTPRSAVAEGVGLFDDPGFTLLIGILIGYLCRFKLVEKQ